LLSKFFSYKALSVRTTIESTEDKKLQEQTTCRRRTADMLVAQAQALDLCEDCYELVRRQSQWNIRRKKNRIVESDKDLRFKRLDVRVLSFEVVFVCPQRQVVSVLALARLPLTLTLAAFAVLRSTKLNPYNKNQIRPPGV
jgi:hypothetical protein